MSGQAEPAPPDAAPGIIIAFLFTDLAGSTRLWEEVPDAMSAALRRHDAILGEAIASSRRLVG
jgi:class 3 adenylate cyclase